MRQGCFQNKTDLQCESNVSVQVRLVEGRGVRLVFHRTFQTACIRQQISLTFSLESANRRTSPYSDTMRAVCRSSDVSVVFCLSAVSCRSICISTVRDSSHGLPVHVASIHFTFPMCDAVAVSSCTPFNRDSLMYTMWPPAWTGFHESCRAFITGPPAASGFPFTPQKASGMDRLPFVCRSIQWASCNCRDSVVYYVASGVDRLP